MLRGRFVARFPNIEMRIHTIAVIPRMPSTTVNKIVVVFFILCVLLCGCHGLMIACPKAALKDTDCLKPLKTADGTWYVP